MACNFSIPFTGSVQDLLDKARAAVEKQGGMFNGNAARGNFSVSALGNTIKGSYTVAGQNFNIVIDSKPFFLPCSTVEGFLKSQLGS
jgi:hypothetical protein